MTAGSALAESLPVLSLSPGTPSFSTGATSNATYTAWTYEAGVASGHDIWTFDLSGWDSAFLVNVNLHIQDYYLPVPDNYKLYWDGGLLVETGVGTAYNGDFNVTAASHTLELEWLNPISGGSWYNIAIDTSGTNIPAVSAVPLPTGVLLFGAGLIGLLAAVRRKSKLAT